MSKSKYLFVSLTLLSICFGCTEKKEDLPQKNRTELTKADENSEKSSLTILQHMESDLISSTVEYAVLLPDNYEKSEKEYPLFIFLHGGDGFRPEGDDKPNLLELYAPAIIEFWEENEDSEMVVITPNAGRSFYLNSLDGKDNWETFLSTEFLTHLRGNFNIIDDRNETFVSGMSMGGMGSLRLALKYPETFGGVVALCPAIEPNFEWKNVELIDRFWRPDSLIQSLYGNPPDSLYRIGNPATIVRDNTEKIKESELKIYIDVGSEDLFEFYRGADFLHNTLMDNKIKHEYHYIFGADHVGNSLPHRVALGLGFIKRTKEIKKPDPYLETFRGEVMDLKKELNIED